MEEFIYLDGQWVPKPRIFCFGLYDGRDVVTCKQCPHRFLCKWVSQSKIKIEEIRR